MIYNYLIIYVLMKFIMHLQIQEFNIFNKLYKIKIFINYIFLLLYMVILKKYNQNIKNN